MKQISFVKQVRSALVNIAKDINAKLTKIAHTIGKFVHLIACVLTSVWPWGVLIVNTVCATIKNQVECVYLIQTVIRAGHVWAISV